MMHKPKRTHIDVAAGELYRAPDGGAVVFTDDHSYKDILRFLIAEVGFSEARHLLQEVGDE
jgi:hypothetical protein